MGVMLTSTQDQKIQEGISEPFWVRNRWEKAPPGFRFLPTDAELIIHYLKKRAVGGSYPPHIIVEVDIYKFDPWDLPDMAAFGENKWYFFCHLDSWFLEIPANRPTHSGYWKDIHKDTTITLPHAEGQVLGVKKTFIFYKRNRDRTPWIMCQYTLDDTLVEKTFSPFSNSQMSKKMHVPYQSLWPPRGPGHTSKDTNPVYNYKWVLCTIFNKTHQQQVNDDDGLGQPPQGMLLQWTDLPPGFRFRPTDVELILHYLSKKGTREPGLVPHIAEVDICKYNPWELHPFGEREWCFFCTQKRSRGVFRNAGSGYWKVTLDVCPITHPHDEHKLLGGKETLIFYRGHQPNSSRTGWIMRQYSLTGDTKGKTSGTSMDEPVLCRIYDRTKELQLSPSMDDDDLIQLLEDNSDSDSDTVLHDAPIPSNTAVEPGHLERGYTTKAALLKRKNIGPYWSIHGAQAG